MEKSIEDIWKQGFVGKREIVVPKIENLYNQKSFHIMDKLHKMGRFNILLLVAFAVIMPIYGVLTSQPHWISILFFLLFGVPAVHTYVKMKELKNLDLTDDSYHYLINLRNWLQQQFKTNIRYSRYFYPLALYAAASMIWFAKGREKLMYFLIEKEFTSLTDIELTLLFWGSASLVAIIMGVFAKKIYKFDVGLLYGNLFKKLNEVISDMEEIRKE